MASVPDGVQKWLSDGRLNVERFYVEQNDDGSDIVVPSGQIAINVGGIFVFFLPLQGPPPFVISMPPTDSKALTKFIKLANAQHHATQGDALTAATKAYLKISDELDAENAEGGENEAGDEDSDPVAVAMKEGRNEAEATKQALQLKMAMELREAESQFNTGGLNRSSIDRVLRDLQAVQKTTHFGWSAAPFQRQLSVWEVKLFEFDKKTKLYNDMKEVAKRTHGGPSHPGGTIDMLVKFPVEYPHKPPFIRVVRPRFAFRTGRVTVGGSICTQLLTEEGWLPTYDLESVIETVREQITNIESKAEIDHANTTDYTESEALEAFQRVAAFHKQNGWN